MRHRSACWAAVLVVVACHHSMAQAPAATAVDVQPEGAGSSSVRGPQAALPGLLAKAAVHPDLSDLTLYLEVRGAAAADDVEPASALARALLDGYPDSIWAGRTRLAVGRVRRRTGDPEGAQEWLDAAAFPNGDGAVQVVNLQRAEVAHELGDDGVALELAAELRDAKPGGRGVRGAAR